VAAFSGRFGGTKVLPRIYLCGPCTAPSLDPTDFYAGGALQMAQSTWDEIAALAAELGVRTAMV